MSSYSRRRCIYIYIKVRDSRMLRAQRWGLDIDASVALTKPRRVKTINEATNGDICLNNIWREISWLAQWLARGLSAFCAVPSVALESSTAYAPRQRSFLPLTSEKTESACWTSDLENQTFQFKLSKLWILLFQTQKIEKEKFLFKEILWKTNERYEKMKKFAFLFHVAFSAMCPEKCVCPNFPTDEIAFCLQRNWFRKL